ncbi:unnamed protein product [Rotaria sp. Silwood2]|nr:unnamed protein product [Rotaria sp. Silwood2]
MLKPNMERQKKIQQQIIANFHQSHFPKLTFAFDSAIGSNSSALHADRSLRSRNLYSSNKHIGQSFSPVDNTPITHGKFSDPEFLPIPGSIKQGNEETSFDDFEYRANVARWLRPEHIRWSNDAEQYQLTVFNQPHSKDIIQGRLGDCWFISALALIVEIPQILYKIMITKQYNPAGLYKIRLCNRGIWQVVTIDDMLPVTESNSLIFARSHKKQLFVSLIEKALAKMHGSYKALGFGLESEHAYSILDAKQVGSQRLVRLRNPWGKKELNSSVSNNLIEWPRILKEKPPTSSEHDGAFWMPWEEICSSFDDITICKINGNEHKARKRGQFSDFSSKVTSAYWLDCPHGAELNIELFNAGDGKYYNRLKEPNVDLFLILLSSNGSCKTYKHSLDYYITLSTTVSAGRYILLAGSMSVVNYSIYSKFNLVVHADQPFVLNEQSSSHELVGNAFHAVAIRANVRKDFGDGVSLLTFNDNGGFGFICENKSNRNIRFTADFQGSRNVLSSRKAFRMVDVIPAKTKQLFAIFTRKVLSEDVNIGK